jgi:hypothetical protein
MFEISLNAIKPTLRRWYVYLSSTHACLDDLPHQHDVVIVPPKEIRIYYSMTIRQIYDNNETLDCRKLHRQLSNSCHRSGKGHV